MIEFASRFNLFRILDLIVFGIFNILNDGVYMLCRIGVVSGKAIFGPPLEEYWRKKLEEEAAAKENGGSST